MPAWAAPIIAATLLGGAGLTAYGLVQHGMLATMWPHLLPELIALAAVATEGVARALRLDRCTAGLAVGACIVLFAGEAGALVTLALLAGSSLVMGHAVLAALGCNAGRIPASLRVPAGAVVWGTIVGIAAHFPVAYPVTYGFMLVASLVAGRRILQSELEWLTQPRRDSGDGRWIDLAIAAVGLYYTGVALMPELGHDALATHLFVPAHLGLRHQWTFDPSLYVWAVMPMLGDWLYGIGYVLAGEAGARLVNLGAILLAARLVRELAQVAGADRQSSKWACLLFLATPLVFTETSSLFIESVWSCCILGASLALLRSVRGQGGPADSDAREALVVAGLLAGGAMAAKAVTFTTLPGLVLFLLVSWKRVVGPAGLRGLGIAVAGCLAIGLVPYAWAWWVTGNPVFPFFNQVFRSPLWPPVAFEAPAVFDKGVRWDLFWRMTFDSGRYLEADPGASGFQWMVLVVPATLALAFSRARIALWLLVFAAVSIVLTFQSTAYLRYVLPAYGWVAAALAAALAVTRQAWLRWLWGTAMLATTALNLTFLNVGANYRVLEPRVLLGPTERQRYLAAHQPMRNLVDVLNAVNDPHAPVGVLGPPLLAGLTAHAVHANWYNQSFADDLARAQDVDAIGKALGARGIEYIVLDPAWDTAERRELARGATDLVAALGEVQLRRTKVQYQFLTELLRNPDLASLEGWGFPGGQKPSADRGPLMVDVSHPAVQTVPVESGSRYKLAIRAQCVPGRRAQGRLQVNWSNGAVDLRTFDCFPEGAEHSIIMTAPPRATTAIVYATAHTDNAIVVEGVSFRK